MKALVVHQRKDLRIEDQPIGNPGIGQVLIKTAVGGICGSDLHYYNHGGFGTVRLKQPMVLGHEVAGYVAGLGEGVDGLTVGDLVAISPSRPCGACEYCHKGLPNHCLNMRFYGSAMPFPHVQGAFQENLLVDASQCVNADGLSAAEAAMAEPLSVGLHAASRAGNLLGKRVLITGCGPIGALVILAARAAGATEIIVTDLSAEALVYARQLGADHIIQAGKDTDAMTPFAAGKGTVDVLFECSGSAAALAAAMPVLRPRGIIMQLGLGGDMTLPVQAMTAKEIELRGSFRFHPEFAMAVRLMQQGLVDVKPVISHTFELTDAVAAFEMASDRTRAMKTHIRFAETA